MENISLYARKDWPVFSCKQIMISRPTIFIIKTGFRIFDISRSMIIKARELAEKEKQVS